ncbi:MAG: hypothetical protein LBD25_05615 [Coriobacteriales bacterium]|jgi:hypothetical protein|nr:hypothetical protein [Coriobacteriales bacterium]
MTKTKLKPARICATLALSLVVLAGTLSLVGCGDSGEQKLKDSIIAQFETARDPSSETAKGLVERVAGEFPISYDESRLMSEWLEGYKVDVAPFTIEQGTDTLKVNVLVSGRKLKPIFDGWLAEQSAVNSVTSLAELTPDRQKIAFDRLLSMLDVCALETKTIEVTCVKGEGGEWQLSGSVPDYLRGVLIS